MDESGKRPGRRSLLPTEIVTRRAATRTVVAAGLGLAAMAGPAEAQRGPTDRDEGPNRDPPGGGRLLSDVDPSDAPRVPMSTPPTHRRGRGAAQRHQRQRQRRQRRSGGPGAACAGASPIPTKVRAPIRPETGAATSCARRTGFRAARALTTA